MAAQWETLSIQIPSPLTSLSSLIQQGLSALKTALTAIKALVQEALDQEVDPTAATAAATNAAIQALIMALTTAINSLLDDGGIYVLPIPLPKKGFVQVLQSVNPDESGSDYINFPTSAIVGGLSDADQMRLQQEPVWQQILDQDNTFLGGNAYFINTLCTSIFDNGDQGRPQWGVADSWAYVLVIAGAPDMTSLGSIATFIDRSFAARSPKGASQGTNMIVPANPRISLSSRGLAAVIQWDPVPASRLLSSYDNSTLVATKFAVIRSSDFRAKTAISVMDLFGTADLTEGLTGNFGATVVDIVSYDSITTRWVDSSPLPTDNSPAYYHVAFRGQLRSPASQPSSQTTEIPYGPLSRCLQITQQVRRANGSTQGTPPDWIRTPSLATLFPPIEGFLDQVIEQLNNLAAGAQTFTDRNNAYLAFIQNEINVYEQKATDIENYITQITSAVTPPSAPAGGAGPSISVKVNSGSGGVSQFVNQIVKDFTDTSDPNVPPFSSGDEFVIGCVITAVGPNASQIQAALALFQALLGAPTEPSPVIAGVQSITQAVVNVQANVAAQLAALTTTTSNAFGANMQPGAASDCTPPAMPATPTFNTDMSVST